MKFGASTFIWASPFSNATLDLVDKVAGMGFDLIEVCVEDPATIDTAAIRKRMEQAGIGATVCGAFGPDRDISSDDSAVRDNAAAYIRKTVDIAEQLGAEIVVGPMYSAVGRTRMAEPEERKAQRTLAADGLRKAADYAQKKGVRFGLEPLNRFETDLINTLQQGVELVEEIGSPNVGLLVDTFHMNIEERSIPDAIRQAGKHIFEFHACGSHRGTPGDDHLAWDAIAKALSDAGFDGPVVIEAFTPKIKEIARAVSIWRQLAPSEDALAQDGLAHLKRIFAA
jgi:D-psicose/D-tagatose/L-ribulose 3-epimerase